MIVRSAKAKKARSVFFQHLNDIDVYVEDSSPETRKLVATLLSNALEGALALDSVFAIGPRAEVLSACQKDQKLGGRPRVYVIDGDLELCTSSSKCCIDRLFVLPRYCIENYLIDEVASTIVLANHSTQLDSTMAGAALSFKKWVADNATVLRRLFTGFAAVRMLAPGIPTVSIALREYLSDDSGVVSEAKVAAKLNQLSVAVNAACGAGEFERCMGRLDEIHGADDESFFLRRVSGKDFLLPLLRLRMNRVERFTRSNSLLKLDLAAQVVADELKQISVVAK